MRGFFDILLVAVFSGKLCAQSVKAAAALAEKPYAVEAALAHKSRVADWRLDFDVAFVRAQRDGRLICIVFAPNPEFYVFGSGDAFAWSDRLVKKCVGENFECV